MADGPDGSIAARAITFARQGCVAFTYDMVGLNDTRQIPTHRTFAADNAHWLWGISLMGLQTWNSVRALDFLESLPDVDKTRLAITGESGGGTQTMMLAAVDDRLAAIAPCVMVSHSMQGGCLCENAPGLRVDASNMEVAALFAPKPQIMVGAQGDWTRTMMSVEGPAIKTVYDLYNQPDNLAYVIFPFNHNINKTSRDAVYQFFGKTLLHDPNAATFTEPPYKREAVADLRVFPDNTPLPADAKTADQLTQSLKELSESQLEKAKPTDKRSLTLFKKTYQPIWERTLNVDSLTIPEFDGGRADTVRTSDGRTELTMTYIGRSGRGDSIPIVMASPETRHGSVTVALHPLGRAAFLTKDNTPTALLSSLLAKGEVVIIPDLFLTGERADTEVSETRRKALNNFGIFFTTYNRTDTQERVQDILTVCAYARQVCKFKHVGLIGVAEAGPWALLAAPAADAVAADVSRLDLTTDTTLLTDALYVPCLRRMGDFRTALTLAAPHPLLLHNIGGRFTAAGWVQDVYAAVGNASKLRIVANRLEEDDLVAWLTASK